MLICEGSSGASVHGYSFNSYDGGREITYIGGIEQIYSEYGAVRYYCHDDTWEYRYQISESDVADLLDFSIVSFSSTPISDILQTQTTETIPVPNTEPSTETYTEILQESQ